MPLINGVKFACNSCIKGHRSSHCNHVERPLFEIRRKGRPVTQCAYCRDLRKTKQVHVKCVCSERKGDLSWLNLPAVKATVAPPPALTAAESPPPPPPQPPHNAPCTCVDHNRVTQNGPTRHAMNGNGAPEDQCVQTASTSSSASLSASTSTSLNNTDATTSSSSSSSSYSWAWISPRLANTSLSSSQENDNLGFVFQKPSGAVRRRAFPSNAANNSPRQRATAAGSTMRCHTRPRSPDYHHSHPQQQRPMQAACMAAYPPATTQTPLPPTIDMALDLESVLAQMDPAVLDNNNNKTSNNSSSSSTCSSSSAMAPASQSADGPAVVADMPSEVLMRELALSGPDDLTTLLNMILQQDAPTQVPAPTAPTPQPPPVSPPKRRMGPCGSIAPVSTCNPLSTWEGESVVITITPLPKQDASAQVASPPQPTTTRVVTCYCGATCTCLGCLVHPSNSFLLHQSFDPYAGMGDHPIASSSSASSHCSSDEDEHMA